jgi:acyl-CoA reductase-like NAD-dependent aldehyde dehydrogenase
MTALAAQRELRNLVAGELVDAVDGGTRDIVNPADGNVIGRVPEGTRADVERAVGAARAARLSWRDTTPAQRMEALLALADAVDAHAALGVDGLIARDPGVAPGVNVREGAVVSAPVAEAFAMAVAA